MVALAGIGGDFHLAQQRVHFGEGQDAAGADAVMAGEGASDMIEPFAQRQ